MHARHSAGVYRYDPARQKLAIGLAFLAGAVDASGFLATGGYFTSFMSGNTTRLGVDLATRPVLALLPMMIIACFVGGVVTGALVVGRWPGLRKRALLLAIAVLLGFGALAQATGARIMFLALAALAMGLANNVFSRDGEVTVGVTYMTGALVRFGQRLAARIAGRPHDTMRGYGALWAALAIGACCGSLAYSRWPSFAAALLCAFALLLFAAACRIEGPSRPQPETTA